MSRVIVKSPWTELLWWAGQATSFSSDMSLFDNRPIRSLDLMSVSEQILAFCFADYNTLLFSFQLQFSSFSSFLLVISSVPSYFALEPECGLFDSAAEYSCIRPFHCLGVSRSVCCHLSIFSLTLGATGSKFCIMNSEKL